MRSVLRNRAIVFGTILFVTLLMMVGLGTEPSLAVGTEWEWQNPVPTGNMLYGVSAVNVSNAWAVGVNGTILHTTNGGATWTPQTSGTDNNLNGVAAANANNIWAVGAVGTILKYVPGTGRDTTFYFAEGTCRPGFDPYICIQNPQATEAQVTITYMKGDGTTDTQDSTVGANSRSTVVVKNKLGEGNDAAHDFSARVESTNDVPIITERPMYFNYGGRWQGGHDVVGQ